MEALTSVGEYQITGNMLTITYAAGQLTFMGQDAMAGESSAIAYAVGTK